MPMYYNFSPRKQVFLLFFLTLAGGSLPFGHVIISFLHSTTLFIHCLLTEKKSPGAFKAAV